MPIFLVAIPASALASWLMPVSLSAGRRPWIDGVLVYPAAIAVLAVGLPLFYAMIGVQGAIWASAMSALVLTAMQLGLLVDAVFITIKQALVLETSAMVATGGLGLIAWAVR